MQVLYTEKEYREMAKEVCFLTNDLKQISDLICQEDLFKDVNTQASATVRGIQIIDQLKNYLVQMNFLTCNVAESMKGRDGIDFFRDNTDTMVDSNISNSHIRDDMELPVVEETNSPLLEDSQAEYDEAGSN